MSPLWLAMYGVFCSGALARLMAMGLCSLVDALRVRLAQREIEVKPTIGKARLEALRADLREVMRAAHGGEFPPIRATW